MEKQKFLVNLLKKYWSNIGFTDKTLRTAKEKYTKYKVVFLGQLTFLGRMGYFAR